MKILYEDLDKYFTAPKRISPFYLNNKKVPRKFKKKWKKILSLKFNTLDQNLWYILEYRNMDYKRFLIKKLLNNYK